MISSPTTATAVLRDIFSLMVFSAELHLAKPDAEIFATALALAEVAPGDTLFIDDRVENLDAALQEGIRIYRFHTAAGLREELDGIDFGASPRRRPWWARAKSLA
ncbi:HAD-IA family hydrolase [Microbacterium sp. NPDC090218]